MAKRTSRSQVNEMNAAALKTERDRLDQPGSAADDKRSMSMASEPSEEDIRLRAYQRYVERGGEHGRDFDDWLSAEQELKRKRPAVMSKQ